MRIAALAIFAAISAATLAGPASAQPAQASATTASMSCPAGSQWVPSHYDRKNQYLLGR